MSARAKSAPSKDSTATIGFEAKLWLTAESRSAVETAEGNFRDNMDAAEPSGARQTAKGRPQGTCGGVHQFGVPPRRNANFALVQQFIHNLARRGMAGVHSGCLHSTTAAFANGSISSHVGIVLRRVHDATSDTSIY